MVTDALVRVLVAVRPDEELIVAAAGPCACTGAAQVGTRDSNFVLETTHLFERPLNTS